MPSIFARHRRGSESLPNAMPDESPTQAKRRSMDVGRPPVTGGKFKSLFSGGEEARKRRLSSSSQVFADDEGKQGSLRSKLTSASQLFHRNEPTSPKPSTAATAPNAPQTPPRPPGAGARYDDPSPRGPINTQFASPTLFPESFSLSATASPEGGQGGRRGSVSWQPSYPTVLPEDSYADLAPDGHPATERQLPRSPVMPSENEHRRSLIEANAQMATPGPDDHIPVSLLAPTKAAESIRPNGQIPTPSPDEMPHPPAPSTPPTLPAPLPTPPPSAVSPGRALPVVDTAPETVDATRADSSRQPAVTPTEPTTSPRNRPHLSLVTSSPEPSTSAASQDLIDLTGSAADSATASPIALTTGTAPTPTGSRPSSRPRPDVPSRRTTLISSPPMPQPIKNLPSMVGWPAFMKEGVPGTPGWGQLAKEGGPKTPGWTGGGAPKTPGWGGMMSPASARIPGTPGTPGFPFSLPQTTVGQNKGKGKEAMSEEELRKARRAMPSVKPEENEGGEVGASDEDDEESETEIEGHGEDDSDDQTETEPAARAGKKPAVPLKSRFRGKGKGKAGVSSLATSVVHEEEDGAGSPSEGVVGASSPTNRPGNLRLNTNSKAKSFWSSLPTPGSKGANSAWTQFTASPSATPVRPNGPGGASGTTSRTESGTGSEITDSYFSSNPASSSVSLATPRTMEPVLTANAPSVNGLGLGPVAAAELAQAYQRAQDEHEAERDVNGDDAADDASDEGGSEESAGMSSQDHSVASPPTSPRIDQDATIRPTPSKRPSLLSRHSRSMVDLSQPETGPTTGTQLETIRSREAAPTKIELPSRTPTSVVSPNTEWAKAPPTPAAGMSGFFWQKTKEGRDIGTLKRRRSADDLNANPPKYEPPFPGTYIPRPRDEEGREKLPGYWCAVHIEGNMQRKMEFSSPGVQSRDRSWKKLYFILHGTSLTVYKFDPHRFPLKVDPHPPIPIVTEIEDEEYLHVHCPNERRGSVSLGSPQTARRGSITLADGTTTAGRRGSGSAPTVTIPSTASSPRRSSVSSIGASPASTTASATSSTGEKDPALFPTPNPARRTSVSTVGSSGSVGTSSIASHFQQNQLVKQYTLQNAESGLAADYVKRKNVVRVRSQGEQFLIQTDSARDVVDWIEAIQAATNVALDLDERPMPKIITLPRRRRRRVPGAPGAAGAAATTTAAASDANPTNADTPEGNAAAVAAAERAERERERMLAEDQAGPVNGN